MTATKTRRKTKSRAIAHRDVEAEVTAKIIEQLEAGTVPWQKSWLTAGLLPTSVSTGRPYRGANVLLLAIEALTKGYSSPYWMTYRQAEEHGGHVKAGEKGTLVIFWRQTTRPDPDSDDPDAVKRGFFLRHFTVFNLDQTEDVTLPPRFDPVEFGDAPNPIELAEQVWDGYVDPPKLRNVVGDSAHFVPSTDEITLPTREQFKSAEDYYSVLFHEGVHSTGHPSRLDRFVKNGEPQHFGSERYAREELVAELGSAMLLSVAEIEPNYSSSAAYIENWLTALKNDRTLVIKAAGQAQKAVDRILGTTVTTEGDAA